MHQTPKQDEFEVDKLRFWHRAHPSYTHSSFKSIARGATLHVLMSSKHHHLQEVTAFFLLQQQMLMTLSDSVFSLLWRGMQKWRDLCVSQHMCLPLWFYRTPLWDRWDHSIFSFFLFSLPRPLFLSSLHFVLSSSPLLFYFPVILPFLSLPCPVIYSLQPSHSSLL